MDKIRENLGIVVREAREKTGLTQSKFLFLLPVLLKYLQTNILYLKNLYNLPDNFPYNHRSLFLSSLAKTSFRSILTIQQIEQYYYNDRGLHLLYIRKVCKLPKEITLIKQDLSSLTLLPPFLWCSFFRLFLYLLRLFFFHT